MRALQHLVDVAGNHDKPVSVCGELAGDPIGVLVLLAMGYRRFSMNLNSIARIKYVLRRASLDELRPLLEIGLRQDNSAALKSLFRGYLEQLGLGSLLPSKK